MSSTVSEEGMLEQADVCHSTGVGKSIPLVDMVRDNKICPIQPGHVT